MKTNNQIQQAFQFTILLQSISLTVKFPCKMVLKYNNQNITEQVQSKGSNSFSFNQQIILKDSLGEGMFQITVFLITQKNSNIFAGTIKLDNQLMAQHQNKHQSNSMTVNIQNCLDNQAKCSIIVIKTKKIQLRKSSVNKFSRSNSRSTSILKYTQNDHSDSQNQVSRNRSTRIQSGSGNKVTFRNSMVDNFNRQRQKSKQVNVRDYQTLPIYENTQIKKSITRDFRNVRSPQQNSRRFQERYEQNFQNLSKSRSKSTQRRIRLNQERIQEKYSHQTLKLKAKISQFQKVIAQKNKSIKDQRQKLFALEQSTLSKQFWTEQINSKNKTISIQQDYIKNIRKQNQELRIEKNQLQRTVQNMQEVAKYQNQKLKTQLQQQLIQFSRQFQIKNQQFQHFQFQNQMKNTQLSRMKRMIQQLQESLDSRTFDYQREIMNIKEEAKRKMEVLANQIKCLQNSTKLEELTKTQLENHIQKLKKQLIDKQKQFFAIIQEITLKKSQNQSSYVQEEWKRKFYELLRQKRLLDDQMKQLKYEDQNGQSKQLRQKKKQQLKYYNLPSEQFKVKEATYRKQIEILTKRNDYLAQRLEQTSNKLNIIEGRDTKVKKMSKLFDLQLDHFDHFDFAIQGDKNKMQNQPHSNWKQLIKNKNSQIITLEEQLSLLKKNYQGKQLLYKKTLNLKQNTIKQLQQKIASLYDEIALQKALNNKRKDQYSRIKSNVNSQEKNERYIKIQDNQTHKDDEQKQIQLEVEKQRQIQRQKSRSRSKHPYISEIIQKDASKGKQKFQMQIDKLSHLLDSIQMHDNTHSAQINTMKEQIMNKNKQIQELKQSLTLALQKSQKQAILTYSQEKSQKLYQKSVLKDVQKQKQLLSLTQIQTLKSQNQSKKIVIKNLQSKLQQCSMTIQQLQMDLKLKQNHIQKLQHKLQTQTRQNESQMQAIEEMNTRLKKQNKSLKNKYEDLQLLIQNQKRLAKLQKQGMSIKMDDLKRKISNNGSIGSNGSKSSQKYNDQQPLHQKNVQKMSLQNLRLKSQQKNYQGTVKLLKDKNNALEQDFSQLQQNLRKNKIQQTKLKEKLQKLEGLQENLKIQQVKKKRSSSQKDVLRESLKDQNLINKLQQNIQQQAFLIQSYQLTNSQLQTDIQNLRSQFQQKQKQYFEYVKELNEKFSLKFTQFKEQMELIENQNENIKKTNKQILNDNNLTVIENRKLKKSVDNLENQVKILKASKQQQYTQNFKQKGQNIIQKSQNQSQKLAKEAKIFQNKLSQVEIQLQFSNKNAKSLQQKCQQSQNQNSKRKKIIKDLQKNMNELQSKLYEKSKTENQIKGDIRNLIYFIQNELMKKRTLHNNKHQIQKLDRFEVQQHTKIKQNQGIQSIIQKYGKIQKLKQIMHESIQLNKTLQQASQNNQQSQQTGNFISYSTNDYIRQNDSQGQETQILLNKFAKQIQTVKSQNLKLKKQLQAMTKSYNKFKDQQKNILEQRKQDGKVKTIQEKSQNYKNKEYFGLDQVNKKEKEGKTSQKQMQLQMQIIKMKMKIDPLENTLQQKQKYFDQLNLKLNQTKQQFKLQKQRLKQDIIKKDNEIASLQKANYQLVQKQIISLKNLEKVFNEEEETQINKVLPKQIEQEENNAKEQLFRQRIKPTIKEIPSQAQEYALSMHNSQRGKNMIQKKRLQFVQKVESLKKDNIYISQENKQLKQKIQKIEKSNQQNLLYKEDQVRQLKTLQRSQKYKYEDKIFQLEADLKSQQFQYDKLKEKLNKLQKQKQAKVKQNELTQEQKTNQISKLKRQISQIQRKNRAQIMQKLNQNNKQGQNHQDDRTIKLVEHVSQIQQKLSQKESQLQIQKQKDLELKKNQQSLKTNNIKLKQELVLKANQTKQLQKLNEKLKQVYKKTLQQISQKEMQVKTVRKENQIFKKQTQKLLSDVDRLMNKLKNKPSSMDQIDLKQINSIQKGLEVFQDKFQIKNKYGLKSSHNFSVAGLKASLGAKQKGLQKVKQKVSETSKLGLSVKSFQKIHLSQLSNMKDDYFKMMQQKLKSQQQLHELKQQVHQKDSKLKTTSQQNNLLKQNISDIDQQNRKLKQAIQDLKQKIILFSKQDNKQHEKQGPNNFIKSQGQKFQKERTNQIKKIKQQLDQLSDLLKETKAKLSKRQNSLKQNYEEYQETINFVQNKYADTIQRISEERLQMDQKLTEKQIEVKKMKKFCEKQQKTIDDLNNLITNIRMNFNNDRREQTAVSGDLGLFGKSKRTQKTYQSQPEDEQNQNKDQKIIHLQSHVQTLQQTLQQQRRKRQQFETQLTQKNYLIQNLKEILANTIEELQKQKNKQQQKEIQEIQEIKKSCQVQEQKLVQQNKAIDSQNRRQGVQDQSSNKIQKQSITLQNQKKQINNLQDKTYGNKNKSRQLQQKLKYQQSPFRNQNNIKKLKNALNKLQMLKRSSSRQSSFKSRSRSISRGNAGDQKHSQNIKETSNKNANIGQKKLLQNIIGVQPKSENQQFSQPRQQEQSDAAHSSLYQSKTLLSKKRFSTQMVEKSLNQQQQISKLIQQLKRTKIQQKNVLNQNQELHEQIERLNEQVQNLKKDVEINKKVADWNLKKRVRKGSQAIKNPILEDIQKDLKTFDEQLDEENYKFNINITPPKKTKNKLQLPFEAIDEHASQNNDHSNQPSKSLVKQRDLQYQLSQNQKSQGSQRSQRSQRSQKSQKNDNNQILQQSKNEKQSFQSSQSSIQKKRRNEISQHLNKSLELLNTSLHRINDQQKLQMEKLKKRQEYTFNQYCQELQQRRKYEEQCYDLKKKLQMMQFQNERAQEKYTLLSSQKQILEEKILRYENYKKEKTEQQAKQETINNEKIKTQTKNKLQQIHQLKQSKQNSQQNKEQPINKSKSSSSKQFQKSIERSKERIIEIQAQNSQKDTKINYLQNINASYRAQVEQLSRQNQHLKRLNFKLKDIQYKKDKDIKRLCLKFKQLLQKQSKNVADSQLDLLQRSIQKDKKQLRHMRKDEIKENQNTVQEQKRNFIKNKIQNRNQLKNTLQNKNLKSSQFIESIEQTQIKNRQKQNINSKRQKQGPNNQSLSQQKLSRQRQNLSEQQQIQRQKLQAKRQKQALNLNKQKQRSKQSLNSNQIQKDFNQICDQNLQFKKIDSDTLKKVSQMSEQQQKQKFIEQIQRIIGTNGQMFIEDKNQQSQNKCIFQIQIQTQNHKQQTFSISQDQRRLQLQNKKRNAQQDKGKSKIKNNFLTNEFQNNNLILSQSKQLYPNDNLQSIQNLKKQIRYLKQQNASYEKQLQDHTTQTLRLKDQLKRLKSLSKLTQQQKQRQIEVQHRYKQQQDYLQRIKIDNNKLQKQNKKLHQILQKLQQKYKQAIQKLHQLQKIQPITVSEQKIQQQDEFSVQKLIDDFNNQSLQEQNVEMTKSIKKLHSQINRVNNLLNQKENQYYQYVKQIQSEQASKYGKINKEKLQLQQKIRKLEAQQAKVERSIKYQKEKNKQKQRQKFQQKGQELQNTQKQPNENQERLRHQVEQLFGQVYYLNSQVGNLSQQLSLQIFHKNNLINYINVQAQKNIKQKQQVKKVCQDAQKLIDSMKNVPKVSNLKIKKIQSFQQKINNLRQKVQDEALFKRPNIKKIESEIEIDSNLNYLQQGQNINILSSQIIKPSNKSEQQKKCNRPQNSLNNNSQNQSQQIFQKQLELQSDSQQNLKLKQQIDDLNERIHNQQLRYIEYIKTLQAQHQKKVIQVSQQLKRKIIELKNQLDQQSKKAKVKIKINQQKNNQNQKQNQSVQKYFQQQQAQEQFIGKIRLLQQKLYQTQNALTHERQRNKEILKDLQAQILKNGVLSTQNRQTFIEAEKVLQNIQKDPKIYKQIIKNEQLSRNIQKSKQSLKKCKQKIDENGDWINKLQEVKKQHKQHKITDQKVINENKKLQEKPITQSLYRQNQQNDQKKSVQNKLQQLPMSASLPSPLHQSQFKIKKLLQQNRNLNEILLKREKQYLTHLSNAQKQLRAYKKQSSQLLAQNKKQILQLQEELNNVNVKNGKLQSHIKEIGGQPNRVRRISSTADEKDKLHMQEIQKLESKIFYLQGQIYQLQEEVGSKNNQIEALQVQLENQRDTYRNDRIDMRRVCMEAQTIIEQLKSRNDINYQKQKQKIQQSNQNPKPKSKQESPEIKKKESKIQQFQLIIQNMKIKINQAPLIQPNIRISSPTKSKINHQDNEININNQPSNSNIIIRQQNLKKLQGELRKSKIQNVDQLQLIDTLQNDRQVLTQQLQQKQMKINKLTLRITELQNHLQEIQRDRYQIRQNVQSKKDEYLKNMKILGEKNNQLFIQMSEIRRQFMNKINNLKKRLKKMKKLNRYIKKSQQFSPQTKQTENFLSLGLNQNKGFDISHSQIIDSSEQSDQESLQDYSFQNQKKEQIQLLYQKISRLQNQNTFLHNQLDEYLRSYEGKIQTLNQAFNEVIAKHAQFNDQISNDQISNDQKNNNVQDEKSSPHTKQKIIKKQKMCIEEMNKKLQNLGKIIKQKQAKKLINSKQQQQANQNIQNSIKQQIHGPEKRIIQKAIKQKEPELKVLDGLEKRESKKQKKRKESDHQNKKNQEFEKILELINEIKQKDQTIKKLQLIAQDNKLLQEKIKQLIQQLEVQEKLQKQKQNNEQQKQNNTRKAIQRLQASLEFSHQLLQEWFEKYVNVKIDIASNGQEQSHSNQEQVQHKDSQQKLIKEKQQISSIKIKQPKSKMFFEYIKKLVEQNNIEKIIEFILGLIVQYQQKDQLYEKEKEKLQQLLKKQIQLSKQLQKKTQTIPIKQTVYVKTVETSSQDLIELKNIATSSQDLEIEALIQENVVYVQVPKEGQIKPEQIQMYLKQIQTLKQTILTQRKKIQNLRKLVLSDMRTKQELKLFNADLIKQKEAIYIRQTQQVLKVLHLQAQLANQKQKNQKIINQYRLRASIIENLKTDISNLNESIRNNEYHNHQIKIRTETFQQKIRSKEKEIILKQNEIILMQNKYKSILTQYNSQISGLNNQLQSIRKNNIDQKDQLRQIIHNLELQILEMKNTQKNVKNQNQSLKNQLQFQKLSSSILEASPSNHEEVYQKLRTAQKLQQQNKDLNQQLRQKDEKVFELSAKVFQYQSKMQGFDRQIKETVQKLEDYWSSKVSKVKAQYQAKITNSGQQYQVLTQQFSEIHKKYSDMSSNLYVLKHQNQKLNQQIDELRKQQLFLSSKQGFKQKGKLSQKQFKKSLISNGSNGSGNSDSSSNFQQRKRIGQSKTLITNKKQEDKQILKKQRQKITSPRNVGQIGTRKIQKKIGTTVSPSSSSLAQSSGMIKKDRRP